MAIDPEILKHKEWLGFLQPVGLVVSPPALTKVGAIVDRSRTVELQQALLDVISRDPIRGRSEEIAWIPDFGAFATRVLGWESSDLVEEADLPDALKIPLPEYGEVLTPTYGVTDPESDRPLMLVKIIRPGSALDQDDDAEESRGWQVSPQAKFERLLRESGVGVGLLCNGTDLRLVYAPRGESSGYLTFPVQAMAEVSGRLILGAMDMLLSVDRLFNSPSDRTLNALLQESRKYQAEVSNKLAGQVLGSLWELLRGFQAADEASNGRLLSEIAQTESQHIYGGLITTLMRLVFLLYAEDEGLLSQDAIYTRNYAVTGLYERLRDDNDSYPDTMDQRYGAWAWLLSLFRLVYEGGKHAEMFLPARQGQLFDPNEYPFLEGRSRQSEYQPGEHIEPPRLSDGVIYQVLRGLLVLDGERLSYRSLDVEQIGSVYEAIMGYAVERAEGASIAVRPKDVVINAEALLAEKPANRAKVLKDWAECKLAGKGATALKEAKTVADAIAALGTKLSPRTKQVMPIGSLYLQPGEERRRSGSHYTPRVLTEPIVRTTLRPVLEGLGDHPTAAQILELKVCDLAMGSGAFLVEACRQLAEQVVVTWNRNGLPADLPEGEEPLLYARRLVAQRCLYGVDKNPFAVSLAKLSLWLVTLAKDQPFTFVDHALKCGDSLVGLTRAQIGSFTWGQDTTYDSPLFAHAMPDGSEVRKNRNELLALGDREERKKAQYYRQAEVSLENVRIRGDLLVASFFAAEKDKARKEKRDGLWLKLDAWEKGKTDGAEVASIRQALRSGEKAIPVFNWEVEFPEVFERDNSGFDAIVGNPPFAGKNTTTAAHAEGYLSWLKTVYPESHGNSDLVAYFFRRSFDLLRQHGSFGLIATNTIAQGDTRSTGLRWICKHGGTIYNAQKRVRWAGQAAVVVSVINIFKGIYDSLKRLNQQDVSLISAYLFHSGGSDDPAILLTNKNKGFVGSYVLGMGFTFDDSNPETTSLEEMYRLIGEASQNQECIFPYIGGSELNSSPTHTHSRYTINFGEMSEAEARMYPDLIKIVETKVKGTRASHSTAPWWQFERPRGELYKAIKGLERVLVCGQTSKYRMFTFLKPNYVFDQKLIVFALPAFSSFIVMQSRIHEMWALFFGSTMKDDPVYTPSDCFETFPFPKNWETDPDLEAVGKQYYEFRADLMVRHNQGLTDTYNRFHDPDESHPDILQLRKLHDAMDRAVLNAYGWHDITPTCTFQLDYEDEDDEDDTSTRRKKKPWRYRWTEDIHDEVLARLLSLNQERAEAEILGGKHNK